MSTYMHTPAVQRAPGSFWAILCAELANAAGFTCSHTYPRSAGGDLTKLARQEIVICGHWMNRRAKIQHPQERKKKKKAIVWRPGERGDMGGGHKRASFLVCDRGSLTSAIAHFMDGGIDTAVRLCGFAPHKVEGALAGGAFRLQTMEIVQRTSEKH